jgi:ABC-2 type transport system permease protein
MSYKIKWNKTIDLFWDTLIGEYKHIFTDAGVLLFFFGAIIIYSVVYSFAYKNEVLREVPIAVVDNCHTATSHSIH